MVGICNPIFDSTLEENLGSHIEIRNDGSLVRMGILRKFREGYGIYRRNGRFIITNYDEIRLETSKGPIEGVYTTEETFRLSWELESYEKAFWNTNW
jgi:hypothetical protein